MSEKKKDLEITPGQMMEFWRQVGIGQIDRAALQKFLDHKLVERDYTLSAWMSIRLGTHLRTGGDFLNAFYENGCRHNETAADILHSRAFLDSIAPTAAKVQLGIATTGDLIGKPGKLREIYAAIKRLGGELLPAEAGPQLRLQYPNQPKQESLLLAMEPMADDNGYSYIWNVACDIAGAWLYIRDVKHGINKDELWVFALPV